jgi:hypothetical protein
VAKPRTGYCRAVEDGAMTRAAARGKSPDLFSVVANAGWR